MKGSLLKRLKTQWIFTFIILGACVEPIEFKVPPAQLQTTIEGMISDGPGPYIVKISEGISLEDDSLVRVPIRNAKVKLYDDEGHIENLTENAPGDYYTGGVIQGRVGHAYHITIETSDGKLFESEPEIINPVGAIDDIRFEYESRSVEENFGTIAKDVFNIYIDSKTIPGNDNFVRWRFTGTYKVLTYPELHWIWALGYVLPDPYPCSGWAYIGRTYAEQVAPCSCCICWAHDYEDKPQLSDGQLISGDRFNNVKVGEVAITPASFYEKYLVDVEQMSLSKTAFEFFKLIRSQKEGSSSLFQPPSGIIKGNIKATNSSTPVVGIFWATSIKTKSIFIQRSSVPYPITQIAQIRYPCQWYPYATTQQPPNW
ncbi:MAG: DUF4249 domain-containing protein [Cyclobacteriaceae bacterium]|nr:DUF4249 domain-containing protein [Cyclobacteriaceae bacterium]